MRISLIFLLAASSNLHAASIRIVNAIPQVDATSAPTLSVYVDGVPLVSQLRYAELVTLAAAPTGLHSFSIRAGDRVLAESQLSFNGAAPNGHMLALAGDGTTQPFRLISWQVQPLPVASTFPVVEGLYHVSHTRILLAPRWDAVTYALNHCWDSDDKLAIRGSTLELPLAFGYPFIDGGLQGSQQPQTCQINARSATKGMLSLRLPPLLPSPHVLTHFLIGNGTARTPFEWLTVDNERILARGQGSYAQGPVIAGPRFLADTGKPGAGVFIGADSTSTRLTGFVVGQGNDFRSTWSLIEGPRIGMNKFKLTSYGGSTSANEEFMLSFQSCTNATLERRVSGNAVSTRSLRRGIVPKSCDEYQQP